MAEKNDPRYSTDENGITRYSDGSGLEGIVCGSNIFRELKRIRDGNFDKLKESVEFNAEEETYWKDMESRRDSMFGEGDFDKKTAFYMKEVEMMKGRFAGRIAVERRLNYCIGHGFEWLATYTHKDDWPLMARAEHFELAAQHYQKADELAGFYTDYAMRQAEACGMVASCRAEAGIMDKETLQFALRFEYLLNAFIGPNVMVISRKNAKNLEETKKMADLHIEGPVDASFFRNPDPSDVN